MKLVNNINPGFAREDFSGNSPLILPPLHFATAIPKEPTKKIELLGDLGQVIDRLENERKQKKKEDKKSKYDQDLLELLNNIF